MKNYCLFCLFIFFVVAQAVQIACGQTKQKGTRHPGKLLTEKYAGEYSFGKNVEKESVGNFSVYPESDTTVLFFLDLCKGAPSYNLGFCYDRLFIKNDSARYHSNIYDDSIGCSWLIRFSKNQVSIQTVHDATHCGFGGNVIADHLYQRSDKKIPVFFVTGQGDTIYFKYTTPEEYSRRNK